MSFRQKLVTITCATGLASALSMAGLAAAHAATGASLFCTSVTANTPYKSSSGKVAGSGSWSCPASDGRTAVEELHHVSGWWHPYVAGNTVSAVYSGSISASGCYPSQVGMQASYFNQVRLRNATQTGAWVVSADGSMKIGC